MYRQPDKHDMNIQCKDSGVMHVLVSDKKPNIYALNRLNKDKAWLERKVKSLGTTVGSIFCMTIDDAGKIFIQKTDGTQIIR